MWNILRIFLVMGLCFVLLTPVNTLALSMQRLRAFVFAAVAAVVAQLVIVVPLGRTVGAEAVAVAHATIAVGMILLVAAAVFGRRMPAAVVHRRSWLRSPGSRSPSSSRCSRSSPPAAGSRRSASR